MTSTTDISPDDDIAVLERYRDLVTVAKHRALRTERYKIIYRPTRNGPRYSLFDIVNDPREVHDLQTEQPALFKSSKPSCSRPCATIPQSKSPATSSFEVKDVRHRARFLARREWPRSIGCGRAAATGCAEQKCAEALPRWFCRAKCAEAGLPRTFAQKLRKLAANDFVRKRARKLLPTTFCAKACGKLCCQRPLCAKAGEAVLPCTFCAQKRVGSAAGRKKQNRSVWEALPQQDGRFTRSQCPLRGSSWDIPAGPCPVFSSLSTCKDVVAVPGQEAPMIGQMVDRYRVVSQLGEGGMGAV